MFVIPVRFLFVPEIVGRLAEHIPLVITDKISNTKSFLDEVINYFSECVSTHYSIRVSYFFCFMLFDIGLLILFVRIYLGCYSLDDFACGSSKSLN